MPAADVAKLLHMRQQMGLMHEGEMETFSKQFRQLTIDNYQLPTMVPLPTTCL
jgi:hypothetical protein